ncbi:MAG: hypothetical protein JXR36_16510 [Bacteroidales bacterium]|nr:hypothetical protein [Bacteroidales bacterium]
MLKVILPIILLTIFFAACNPEKKAFNDAKKQNTQQSYTDFIQGFPESELVAQAKDLRQSLDEVDVVISTFLGNETRNYNGDSLPDKLDTIWQFYLGEGLSPAYGYDKIWKGAGWTGQPLLVKEKGKYYLIQGAFDYGIHKIDIVTGKEVWVYKFDDILKGTGSIWINKNAEKIEERYVIIQGSRKGWDKDHESDFCWSFRAVSYITGKELWRHNSIPTDSYSRDVDGSALVINDTAYLALENALFTVFDADFRHGDTVEGFIVPKVFKQLQYYTQADIDAHGDDLVAEASPTLLNNHLYTPSGTGWIYGYNILTGKNDWEFYIGADLNGSMPVTFDNCLLVPIEKQYIDGKGGVMKIDPTKNPEDAVVWFMPTDTVTWLHWEGGIIGSVTINDKTKSPEDPFIATFIDCKGDLYIVDYININPDTMVLGPNLKNKYATPKLLAKVNTYATISTPIIVQNRILVSTDSGLFLFEFHFVNKKFEIELLDKIPNMSFDATPIAWNGRIYLADFNGYLWCFGRK